MPDQNQASLTQAGLGPKLINWLNLGDILAIFQSKEFWGGLIVRVATLFGFLIFFNIGGDLNDMNELLYKGMINLIQGIYPYGQTYQLTTFGGTFTQSYFNYPPIAILFHLPALLWPGPHSIGTIDFMPGFFLLHTIFDFITYYRLYQAGHTRAPGMIWINPGMVFVNIITFLSLPLLLLTLTMLNIDDPFRCGLYASLLATSYQIGIVFLPFFIIYYFHQNKLTPIILGMLPAILITGLFFILNPIGLFHDLIVAQFLLRYPINWMDPNPTSPFFNRYYPLAFLFMGSIPALIFNFAIGLGVQPEYAPRLALPMILLVGLLGLILLIQLYKKPRRGLSILFSGLILALLIASTTEGIAHYWVLTILLPFHAWRYREDYWPRKKS